MTTEIGVIGGSGLYDLDESAGTRDLRVGTPFGPATVQLSTFAGREVAFISRHGRGHRIHPSDIPFRENIYALKSLGVRRVISVSAVGSLRQILQPGHLVVPDQIVDWTRGSRPASFFSAGLVVHVSLADPYCPELRAALAAAAESATDATVHDGGTYICIEGPQFSTRAESHLYRALGMDIIGMTAMPEARLAREAGLCYASLALVTDYDCWRHDEEDVDADLVATRMAQNVAAAKQALAHLMQKLPDEPDACGGGCGDALAHAVITDRGAVPDDLRERLGLLLDRQPTD
jgi:5'-methylthioadenosine phosphorylase